MASPKPAKHRGVQSGRRTKHSDYVKADAYTTTSERDVFTDHLFKGVSCQIPNVFLSLSHSLRCEREQMSSDNAQTNGQMGRLARVLDRSKGHLKSFSGCGSHF